jgi:phosphoribosylamine---glycine ligase
MRVLVVGSGGREHALAWKIRQSKRVERVLIAPGNAGTGEVGENFDIPVSDHEGLLKLCREHEVGLAVIGPEVPLVAGLADRMRAQDVKVFGPGASGSRLEGSKTFCKTMMQRYVVPTAGWRGFDDVVSARNYLESARDFPVVLKADGLAAGKGVLLPETREEALEAVEQMMVERVFGDAGARVIVEDCLRGKELSVLALTDGRSICVLESAQDFKRALDGDKGLNTGGMGSFSPSPAATDKLLDQVSKDVLVRIAHGLTRERIDYRGVLYAGLMLTRGGPKVLEFNCRFGDPETQVVLARMKSDIVPLLMAVADGRLGDIETLEWDPRTAVCVVMASKGYPVASSNGDGISGLDEVKAMDDVVCFHAGTARDGNRVVTNGGRVLGITALGDTAPAARERAYEAVAKIRFDGMQFRTDIAEGI